MIILKWISKTWDGKSVDRIHLTQNTDTWWAVNMVMNLRVLENVGKIFTNQEGVGSMELFRFTKDEITVRKFLYCHQDVSQRGRWQFRLQ
jgi:hypothetical protein